ncbi:hypothetical protein PAXRUDRAFT_834121 [Paxillus rubicundulus Ve08.2h10]|uniref:Peptidase M20 dimerisation domain-containing protein n=1 Tax=Paxillus rubicundulus Ve08.2h10 TaxID=930991 RepID=A0A0D0DM13_9AGAM|nr:hypothetical protein PAXRUDRAFT_834121 [Paxillus rubicundulus Ve08.2h10]
MKEGHEHIIKMGCWLHDQLAQFVTNPKDTELVELGIQDKTDPQINLPPLVLACIREDLQKKTVLVYGHYDIQPVGGWEEANLDNPDAFKLGTTDKEKLIGHGAMDDKGPIMGWLNVLKVHKLIADSLGKPLVQILPVNIWFLFEGMEESSSLGLDNWINKEAKKADKGWFKGVNCDITFFSINIEGATNDLHLGLSRRMVHKPMTDMVKLFSALVRMNGVIFKEVEEMVPAPTDDEKVMYGKLDYAVDDLQKDTGKYMSLSEVPLDLVMGHMWYPSLSIHGIKGAFDTITAAIPHNISRRFMHAVHKLVPDYAHDGGSIPIVLTLKQALDKKNILLLSMGNSNDGSQDNYFKGTKVYGTYLYELAKQATS